MRMTQTVPCIVVWHHRTVADSIYYNGRKMLTVFVQEGPKGQSLGLLLLLWRWNLSMLAWEPFPARRLYSSRKVLTHDCGIGNAGTTRSDALRVIEVFVRNKARLLKVRKNQPIVWGELVRGVSEGMRAIWQVASGRT